MDMLPLALLVHSLFLTRRHTFSAHINSCIITEAMMPARVYVSSSILYSQKKIDTYPRAGGSRLMAEPRRAELGA